MARVAIIHSGEIVSILEADGPEHVVPGPGEMAMAWDDAIASYPLSEQLSSPDTGPDAVPPAVLNIQLRRALRQTGLAPDARAFAATLSEDDREEWEYAPTIHRDHPLIALAAVALNKTEAEVDDLFRLAGTL